MNSGKSAAPPRGTVVHIIDGLGRGGAERLLTLYAPELQQQGFRVEVVVLKVKDGNPEAARLTEAGIGVHFVPLGKLRNLRQISAALQRISSLRPTVIHTHLEAATFLGGLARLWLRVPVISTLHTLEHPDGLNRHSARRWVVNRLLTGVYDRVICLSDAILNMARKNGLPRAPLVALANGIPLPARDLPRKGLRSPLGIPANVPLIITVAVLRPLKGIDYLIAAMPAIRETVADAHLLIVGDGPERGPLEAAARSFGLEQAITFAGYREDVADLLREADVFVLPTLWDALPTVVIEAMAASLPIVASSVGGLPDMVRDGVEGRLVAPKDVAALASSVTSILADPAQRVSLGKNARQRAESEFSLEGQVARLATIYSTVGGAKAS